MNSWRIINLGDAATFVNGYAFKPSDWSDQGNEIIRIQNLTKSSKEVNYFEGQIAEKYKVSKGDLLISWSATLGMYEWEGEDSWLNQHIFKVVFDKEEFDKNFFKYLISGSLDRLGQEVHGATMKHITKKKFDAFKIPLPPLLTQKKIADILDAADAHRQKTKQLLAKYDELAQSIFLEMFGDPVTNPKGWDLKKLEDCTTKIGSGATPRGGKDAYKEEGISLIRSLNIHDNKFKLRNLALIDRKQSEGLKNVIVEKGDVLFNITGASVCRCCIVPKEVLPARVNQHVSILRPALSLDSEYLMYFMISKNQKIKLLELATKGGATREAITKQDLQDVEILVPDIFLQRKFSVTMGNLRRQVLILNEELHKSDNLFNSLLQKAFSGELVK
jgi:type I restriction enzyme S subunit